MIHTQLDCLTITKSYFAKIGQYWPALANSHFLMYTSCAGQPFHSSARERCRSVRASALALHLLPNCGEARYSPQFTLDDVLLLIVVGAPNLLLRLLRSSQLQPLTRPPSAASLLRVLSSYTSFTPPQTGG